MSAILISLIVGIIATLLGAFVLKFNENFLPRIPRTRKARKLIGQLKKKYLTHFQAQRDGRTKVASRLQYYFRDHDPTSKSATQLTFSFFAEQDFELEEFKGFLIPPLNREGVRTDGDHDEHLRSDITSDWKEYFQNIGRKAERTLEKTCLSCAQRIVFFDRFLLDFFISERASLLKYGRISKDERDRLTVKTGHVPESSQLVRYAIRSAYTTAMIHELNRGYSKPSGTSQPPIITYYYDKGHVKSTVYCDFGLYGIAGHTFVYMPIYRRGLDKRLVGERVFIDDTSLQRARINEFRESFNDLWEECEKQKHAEMKHRNRAHTKLSDIDAYCFSHEFFEVTYIRNVIKIFEEEFHWDLIADKALPS